VLQRGSDWGGKGGQGCWCTELMSQRVDRRRYFDHVLLGLTSAADKSDWIVKSVLWP